MISNNSPETNAFVLILDSKCTPYSDNAQQLEELANFARKLERERDEAREQIASCAINTNVRLFDLVRYSRASLHADELITDEEYVWLCGGAEMANSPKGGSPSPRRLEDYDAMREQLEAMRETMIATEAYQTGLAADNEAMREAIKEAYDTIKDSTDNCLWRSDSPIPLSTEQSQRLYNRAIETMENLQPFIK